MVHRVRHGHDRHRRREDHLVHRVRHGHDRHRDRHDRRRDHRPASPDARASCRGSASAACCRGSACWGWNRRGRQRDAPCRRRDHRRDDPAVRRPCRHQAAGQLAATAGCRRRRRTGCYPPVARADPASGPASDPAVSAERPRRRGQSDPAWAPPARDPAWGLASVAPPSSAAAPPPSAPAWAPASVPAWDRASARQESPTPAPSAQRVPRTSRHSPGPASHWTWASPSHRRPI